MKLTPTMQRAVELARYHDGKLMRHSGGYWAGPDWKPYDELHFGTNTVRGLVERGAAEYTDWRENRNDRYPVEITLLSENGC